MLHYYVLFLDTTSLETEADSLTELDAQIHRMGKTSDDVLLVVTLRG